MLRNKNIAKVCALGRMATKVNLDIDMTLHYDILISECLFIIIQAYRKTHETSI